MGTYLTIAGLVIVALFLLFVLTSGGKKSPPSASIAGFGKDKTPAATDEMDVIQSWYAESKRKEFEDNVLKDLAKRIKGPPASA